MESFTRLEETVLNVIWRLKRPGTMKLIMKSNIQTGVIISDLRLCYRGHVSQGSIEPAQNIPTI